MSAPKFAKEADLCAAFISALPKGWTAYPEWGGFDILLVGPGGIQIGVEAKLALNPTVIEQAREPQSQWHLFAEGPDFRAVLVPEYATARLKGIAAALGVTVIRMLSDLAPDPREPGGMWWGRTPGGGRYGTMPFKPGLPDPKHDYRSDDHWHDFWPWKRIELPEVVPDCAAGCPAPLRLTYWKVRAIKVAILLDRRGTVTRADFKALGIDMGRWTQCGWLVRTDVRGRWHWGEHHPDFRRDHPRNYDEIAEQFDKWAPPEAAPPPAQGALL